MIPDSKPIEFYRNKVVAVTGVTGLIGSYVARALTLYGAKVMGSGHRRPGNDFCQHFIDNDLMIPAEARRAVKNCEIVLNCAGITGGIGLAYASPLDYVGPATAMACNVIHACQREGVARLGFLSSTTVYAPSDSPVVEEDAFTGEPYDLYWGIGQSKRFVERLCQYYVKQTDLKVSIVRPSGAYGRFDNFDEQTSHVIPGMISRAMRLRPGEDFVVWGDGQDVRDLVHAQDVAQGLLLATAHDGNSPVRCPTFNIASGRAVSTQELAFRVLHAAGSGANVHFDVSKPTALKSRTVSIERARHVLGYEPAVSLEEGLADTVGWLKGVSK